MTATESLIDTVLRDPPAIRATTPADGTKTDTDAKADTDAVETVTKNW
jgi:hypothetical protein